MVDSVRVFPPGFRVTDSEGAVAPGAKIKFYNAQTTTPRTVYLDSGLTSSLGSIVYCGADGAPVASQGSSTNVTVYTGTTAFKVVLTDDSDVEILTFDNLLGALDTSTYLTTASQSTLSLPVITKSSDYTIVSGDRGKVINVNTTGGDVTLTLDSATTLGDGWNVEIRNTGTANKAIIATAQTLSYDGTTATTRNVAVGETAEIVCDAAAFHISNAIRAPIVPQPQGYLTLTSGTPVLASDVSAATSLYYTPFIGELVPIWNGVRFIPTVFSEMTLTLSTSNASNSIYDVFVFNDAGTLRLVTGPVWAASGAAAGSRGTGAGTTQITRSKGLWTNAVAMTGRNGATTYSVGAGYGTYLGSIFVDSTAGQLTCHVTYGQSRKWAVWNAYNRVPLVLKAGDSTTTWSYGSASTFRASNNSTANSLTLFCGLPEERFDTEYSQYVVGAGSGAQSNQVGIGFNSTSAVTGYSTIITTVAGVPQHQSHNAKYVAPPTIGINVLTSLEISNGAASTFYGTEARMLLSAKWRG